ncbi:MAG: hypothetical protein KDA78_07495, partial [Planctomycetaceae bacterium]|nr:hypothetical protein [Planctomycetaceae bacterium]
MSLDIKKTVENIPSAATGQIQSPAPLCEHHGHRQHPLFVSCDETHTVIDLGCAHRIALMVTPDASDEVNDQIWEAVAAIRAVLKQQPVPMILTFQSVFLRRAEDAAACRRLFEAYFGDKLPVTNYYVQPPCGGQALAIEAWGVGGAGVEVEFPSRDVAKISYDGLRWFYTGGVRPAEDQETAFGQGRETFRELAARLQASDFRFNDVVRIWLYMGGITAMDAASGLERYRELNRARTEFFDEQEQAGLLQIRREGRSFFPASTGIGMGGEGLEVSCMALQTDRDDVQLIPLENPNQTSAFEYAQTYSPKSPKFSRAMAEIVGNSVITWVSGTASIIDSQTVH